MNRNPFVGPGPIPAGSAIFGRSEEVSALEDQLLGSRIVLLHSPSGAGKTSLIQAGLLPALAAREHQIRILPIIRLAPGVHGQTRLANPLVAATVEALATSGALGSHDTGTLQEAFDSAAPPDSPTPHLIVFDQFEEVLTSDVTDDDRSEFFRQLGDALARKNRWALFSMREEFVGNLDPFLRLLPTQLRSRFRLDLLTDKQAATAVRGTVGSRGVDEESLQRMIDDLRTIRQPDGTTRLGAFVEPVHLQIVGLSAWDRQADDKPLRFGTPAGESAKATIDEALAHYYGSRLKSLCATRGSDERALREWFDTALITARGVRGLTATPPPVANAGRVVKTLADAYLIRIDSRPGRGDFMELSHDRLIEPVRRDNADWFARHLTPLQRQAQLWIAQQRPSSLLLDRKALALVEERDIDRPDEREFVAASRTALSHERFRTVALSLIALLVVLVLVGGLVLKQQKNQELNGTIRELEETQKALKTSSEQILAHKMKLEELQRRVNAAAIYGYSNEQLALLVRGELGHELSKGTTAAPDPTDEPMRANLALVEILKKRGSIPPAPITVQHFVGSSADYDVTWVRKYLKSYGFRLSEKPGLQAATNTLWYSPGLASHPDEVRIVALVLMRAGVQLRAIRTARRDTHVIQIGSSTESAKRPPLTVHQIMTSSPADLGLDRPQPGRARG